MRIIVLFISILLFLPSPLIAHEAESIKVVVVGDTGIGERAFHPGFEAVQNAMRKEQADAILHLGDFVYQPKGCWDHIAPMATPFDTLAKLNQPEEKWEGVMHLGTALFVVLDVYEWSDPTHWLKPVVDDARRKGLWVIFAMHEPAITTAWYKEKRQTVLTQVNALHPVLVFAGNQHAYERFFPMGIPQKDGTLPVVKKSNFKKGTGVTHVVSGGGGALLKPFADLQGKSKRTAPAAVSDALAKRALMFHYLTLKISHDTLNVTTHRVCPSPPAPGEEQNPRWHADDPMWNNIVLECDGMEAGVTVFDQLEIKR